MEEADIALKEAKEAIRPKGKSSKRTILGELKNVEKWEKLHDDKPSKEADKPSKKAKIVDLSGQENENLTQKSQKPVKNVKKTTKKKQPTLLKGQTKMTAFFLR